VFQHSCAIIVVSVQVLTIVVYVVLGVVAPKYLLNCALVVDLAAMPITVLNVGLGLVLAEFPHLCAIIVVSVQVLTIVAN